MSSRARLRHGSAAEGESGFLYSLKKSWQSIQEIGNDSIEGFKVRGEKAYDSIPDFTNHVTFGISGAIWSGAKDRTAKRKDSVGDYLNYWTLGFTDTVAGAVNPDDPFSKEHWANRFGLATSRTGSGKVVTTKPTSGVSGTSKSKETDSTGKKISEFNVRNIEHSKIMFSQSSVKFSKEIINSMKVNGWKGEPIDVVKMPDRNFTTIDNTGVAAAGKVGIEVKATDRNYSDPLLTDMVDRFTTKKGVPTTWGDALDLRIKKQKARFRNNDPMGSFELEKMK